VALLTLNTALDAAAADAAFTGEFNTLLRMGKAADNRKLYPAYEYLRMQASQELKDGSEVSIQVAGWGRLDLADKSSDERTNGDIQYALLSYHGAKNNLTLHLGRQFVAEGVAADFLDGAYVRQDFAGGVSASAFVGKPVMTGDKEESVDVLYGTRLSHTLPNYYTIGISALQSHSDSGRYRQEGGIDLWARPYEGIDVTGRTSYNGITEGWMEHAYAVSYAPLENLKIAADVQNVNYKHYFHNMTLSAFSLRNVNFNPNEKMLNLGGTVAYTPLKDLTLTPEYRNYRYEIAGQSHYFGGKVGYRLSSSFVTGIGFYRMEGDSDRLRYNELRAYAAKKFGNTDLTLDCITLNYDEPVNGIRSSYAITGALAHTFDKKVKVGADLEYSRTPDFDHEVRGLLKMSYLLDSTQR
jgi:hypothetical protein